MVLSNLSNDLHLYKTKIEALQKSLSSILSECPSIKLPLGVVFGELLGRIQVRYYSISSSSLDSPTTIGVTAVLVNYAIPSPHLIRDEPQVAVKQGLATSHLLKIRGIIG